MVDQDTSLFHNLVNVPLSQRVSRIPSDLDQVYVDLETHSFIGAPEIAASNLDLWFRTAQQAGALEATASPMGVL